MRTRMSLSLRLVVVPSLAMLAGCSSPADEGAIAQPGPAAPAASAAPATTPGVPPGTGKVLETMDAASYTYVRVDLGGKDAWAAGPKVTVKVGDTVTLPAGMPMANYHSATLDRTFPVVYFVGAIGTGDAAAPVADAMAAAHGHAAAPAVAPATTSPVARLDGGQTVEEIVTKAKDLAGKDVAVRGRVVKFNAGILGSNWLHVQDGSGAAGTNDLAVTTDATVAVGDVVVVRGKVTTDKDFGAGYRFAVILEKAAVEKQ